MYPDDTNQLSYATRALWGLLSHLFLFSILPGAWNVVGLVTFKVPQNIFAKYLNFFGAAAESAVCISLGQAYITLLITFSLCVIMNFPSNYKCRASICSLFSQVTVGALLLGFFVSSYPSYSTLVYSIVDCLILLLFSSDKTFCA